LYAADMVQAQQALMGRNLGRVRELLDKHWPKPGEEGIRGWEWRYLCLRSKRDERAPLGFHSNGVVNVAFSADGRLLASGGLDGVVKLWNPSTRQELGKLPQPGRVRGLAFSAAGNLLAVGAGDRTVILWDATLQKAVWRMPIVTRLPGGQAMDLLANLDLLSFP